MVSPSLLASPAAISNVANPPTEAATNPKPSWKIASTMMATNAAPQAMKTAEAYKLVTGGRPEI